MKRRTLAIACILAAAVLAAPGARAGGWFGLHIGSDGVGFSLGFSTWEPYTDRWYDPSWSLDFETALAPYGQWIRVDGLGRVWHPYVAASWRPYTYGRWVWTSYGWTWVAYEPWGYIPHHFGRWALCGSGWVWVPGYTYTPASVVWLSGGSLVGWYAAPPPGWSNAWWRGYHRGYRDGYGDGYRDGWRDARYATWVAWNDFTTDNVARRAWSWYEVERRIPRAAARPLPSAPARAAVERRLGRPVPVAEVSERTVRIGSHSVRVARPEGVRRDIERYASDTLTRGLDRRVSTRIERRVTTSERTVTSRPLPGSGLSTTRATRGVTRSRTPSRDSSRSSFRRVAPGRSEGTRARRRAPGSRAVTRSAATGPSRITSRSVTRSRTSSSASATRRRSRTVTGTATRTRTGTSRSRTVTRSRSLGSARIAPSLSRTRTTRSRTPSSGATRRSAARSRSVTSRASSPGTTTRKSSRRAQQRPQRTGRILRPRR